MKIILDVDTGTDDAVAIMLAALHPALDLLAVTTVNGNVAVDRCTENSLRVLDYIGRGEVPVYEGCSSPLARTDFPSEASRTAKAEIHGEYLDLPRATSRPRGGPAAVYLSERFREARSRDEQITLVATGPLTNLALALKLDPCFARNVQRLAIMGGGDRVSNTTPAAEFNIWADPEAARVVLSSGIPDIVLVTLDATHEALVSYEDCAKLRALGTPAGTATAAVVERRIRAYDASQPMARPATAPVHDALCVAYLIDESVLRTKRCWVDVETSSPLTVGRTVIDTRAVYGREPNVTVGLGADEAAFVSLLLDTFARS